MSISSLNLRGREMSDALGENNKLMTLRVTNSAAQHADRSEAVHHPCQRRMQAPEGSSRSHCSEFQMQLASPWEHLNEKGSMISVHESWLWSTTGQPQNDLIFGKTGQALFKYLKEGCDVFHRGLSSAKLPVPVGH